MSKHDCQLIGNMPIKPQSSGALKAAIKAYLKARGKRSYAEEVRDGNILIADGELSVLLDVYGDGGYSDDHLITLELALCAAVVRHGYLTLNDWDTGDASARETVLFIGETDNDKFAARSCYAVEMIKRWLPLNASQASRALKLLCEGHDGQEELLSEEALTSFMVKRIDNGDLHVEDIPCRLARYGLMDPREFSDEMRDRMQLT